MKKKFYQALLVLSLWIFPIPLYGEGKFSGLVFGDFFWMSKHHTAQHEGLTGVWIRRGYLTYDHIFDEDFSGRFRLEVISRDFTRTSDVITPFVKEASLKWQPKNHAVMIGMIPTPTWVSTVEEHWGYRSVEKTPVDLQRFGSAVDLGAAVKGTFGEERRLGYHLVFGNGSGTRSEVNTDKKIYSSFHIKPIQDLIVEAYGDFETGVGHTKRYMFQGFLGYTQKTWRVGSLFAWRVHQLAAGGNRTFKLLSAHSAFKFFEKWWGFLRVDRMFNPNPDGDNIEFIPFDSRAESTFALVGVDFEPAKDIHLMPNVETIIYDKVNGSRPGTDLVPRLTFYWKF